MIKPLSKNKLKFYQKLNQKKYRDQEELYLISGLRGVQSAFENDPDNCLEIVVEETKTGFLSDLGNIRQKQISTVSLKDFKTLNNEKNPQGICLVAKKPATVFNIKAIGDGRIIFLDRINDPGNLGTILRSAAWFGIKKILLSPNSTDPFQPKVVRSSAGTINAVQIFENVDPQEIAMVKSEMGYKIFATDVIDGQDLSSIAFDKKTLFMFGSEAHGLAKEYEDLCDEKICIQKAGSGESLNLSNAVSIVLYQAALY